MSGIYGIYRYDGAPVDPRWLERMKTAMAYYGPDGAGSRVEGPVGMGHLLLEINPEDAFEKQPVRGERGIVVSAARLDNRAELLEAFHVSSSEAPGVSDGQLVSLAFDRWGEEVCSHLQGNWALAGWDARERRLFLARDVFGLESLYYHQGNGFVAFASSLKALLALPTISKESDFLYIAEILVNWTEDAGSTAYKGLRSVIGAHAITAFSDGRIHERRYWSPEGREPLRYRRDEDYVEAFLEHFTRAVRSCLRSPKPVAAMLSGGRDSGSVVALAAPILASQGRSLTAFTSVPWLSPAGADEERVGNEWELAHATATMAGSNVRHVPIDARDYGVIEGIEHYLDFHDGPSEPVVNNYWIKASWEACTRSGAKVLLTGEMGNLTVSWWGNGSAASAMMRGQPATAFRLFLQAEPNPWFWLKRQIIKPLLKPLLEQAQRTFRRLQTPLRPPWQVYSALNPSMARELDLEGRMRAAGYDSTGTIIPFGNLRLPTMQPKFGTTFNISAELDAWHSVSTFDPTANVALLEFLLRVPDDQSYLHGQECYLFKRAFRNRMPDAVLYNRRKGLQAADVGHRILSEQARFRATLHSLEAVPEAKDFLDFALLYRCLEDLTVKVDPMTTLRAGAILLRGIGVGLFLHRLTSPAR